MTEPRENMLYWFPHEIIEQFKGGKKVGLRYIYDLQTLQKYINKLPESDRIKANNIVKTKLENKQKVKEASEKIEQSKKQVYSDIQIPQSKNTIPNFKYSSIKDFNFLGNIKIDNLKYMETYIELSVNISFDLYQLYYSLLYYIENGPVTTFYLKYSYTDDDKISFRQEVIDKLRDSLLQGNLIPTLFDNLPNGCRIIDKINYYEIQDNSGKRVYFVDDYLDINKYMFLFGSSSIGPASIHPYKSLMIYFVNHVKRINIGAVMLTPNRQSYIIHCLAIPIDKNDLCSSARIEFYSYPENYTLYLNLSDVLIKS